MTPIRETLATIAACAAVPSYRPMPPIPGEHPATAAIVAGQAAAERAPFTALHTALVAFFGADPADAFDGPDAGQAEVEARRIIGEHLAQAATRIVEQDLFLAKRSANREALLAFATAATKQAADLRFVEMLSDAKAYAQK